MQRLESGQIISAFWEILSTVGQVPEAREEAQMVVIDGAAYMFGGFARQLNNDLKVIELDKGSWHWSSLTK